MKLAKLEIPSVLYKRLRLGSDELPMRVLRQGSMFLTEIDTWVW